MGVQFGLYLLSWLGMCDGGKTSFLCIEESDGNPSNGVVSYCTKISTRQPCREECGDNPCEKLINFTILS